jgi:hypothetical protein
MLRVDGVLTASAERGVVLDEGAHVSLKLTVLERERERNLRYWRPVASR